MKRRIVRLEMSIEFMVQMFTTGWTSGPAGNYIVCTKGLPEGAKFIGSTADPMTMLVTLFFEHDSFEEVELGLIPPSLSPEFTKHYAFDWMKVEA